MKTRQGFVSNSSSSSFIIKRGNIEDVSLDMLDVIIENFEEGLSARELKKAKAEHKRWRANLKSALKNKDVKEGKIGVTMPSCNYDTYLVIDGGDLYITTCNNYQWNINDINREETSEHNKIYGLIGDKYFYNICDKIIRSCEKYVEGEESKCPKCDGYYGNYVLDQKGDRICGSCLDGKLEPTDAVKLQNLRANGAFNSISSLKLEDE